MKYPAIKSGWVRSMIYMVSMILVLIVFGIPAFALASALSEKPLHALDLYTENIYILIVYQLFILIGITGLTIIFRKYIDRKKLVTLGFGKIRRNKDLILGLLLGPAIIGTGFIILYFSGNLEIHDIRPDYSHLGGALILCILISWIEEISFRGYILNNMLESFHPYTGLFVSSLLFAAFHMFNPGMAVIPFVNLFLAGILLGVVFIYTKTIWYALSLHFSWNFFLGPVFGFEVSGIEMGGFIRQKPTGDDLVTGGNFGFEGSLLCSLLIILCIFALNRYYNNRKINALKDKT